MVKEIKQVPEKFVRDFWLILSEKKRGSIMKLIAKEIIRQTGIDYCPCCYADLPPKHPLKYVHTKKIPKGGRR